MGVCMEGRKEEVKLASMSSASTAKQRSRMKVMGVRTAFHSRDFCRVPPSNVSVEGCATKEHCPNKKGNTKRQGPKTSQHGVPPQGEGVGGEEQIGEVG